MGVGVGVVWMWCDTARENYTVCMGMVYKCGCGNASLVYDMGVGIVWCGCGYIDSMVCICYVRLVYGMGVALCVCVCCWCWWDHLMC